MTRDYDIAAGRAQQEAQRGEHLATPLGTAHARNFERDVAKLKADMRLAAAARQILDGHKYCREQGIDSYDGVNHEQDIAMLREAAAPHTPGDGESES